MPPRLDNPPIVEVVCGFFFAPVPGLDPMMIGRYWAEKKERAGFPRRQLHPPVADRQGIFVGSGVAPVRCWLLSEEEDTILQIQPDRFYFNWKRGPGAYPRFGDHDGTEGVLTRSLRELEELSTFCRSALGVAPEPARVELTKIDHLEQGRHFEDSVDLGVLLPVVSLVATSTKSRNPVVQLRVADERDGFEVHLHLTNAVLAADGRDTVRLETRTSAEVAGQDLRGRFEAMNKVVNEVFDGLIPKSEWHRFGKET